MYIRHSIHAYIDIRQEVRIDRTRRSEFAFQAGIFPNSFTIKIQIAFTVKDDRAMIGRTRTVSSYAKVHVTSLGSWFDFDEATIYTATLEMEIPGIYGFHFLDGVGRVTRSVREENIQRVERWPRRVPLKGTRRSCRDAESL